MTHCSDLRQVRLLAPPRQEWLPRARSLAARPLQAHRVCKLIGLDESTKSNKEQTVAFRSVAVPWLSCGLMVLGYAAYSWRRAMRNRERPRPESRVLEPQQSAEPLAPHLERVPHEAALDPASERLPANSNAASHGADLGALFLGRASVALSAFHSGPHGTSGVR